LTDEEARQNFDVNVFGVLNVIRHAMPYLRAQQSGHIFNIASVGGYFGGFAGWGFIALPNLQWLVLPRL
jgi:NAD(P)-dependent dehydrogenase (short-subunit alcohol dehydrogenase family)